MAVIQLNAIEESLIILLAILLIAVLVILIIIVYKNSLQKEQEDHQLWHDFIILDSPDQMIALKNSQSLSLDRTMQHQMPSYNRSAINNYNNTIAVSETILVPKSPPPVYHHHHHTISSINK
jgi:hypothetical protein